MLTAYVVLVGLVVLARLVELSVARRHEAWARARGAVESGRRHYPVMVALHTALLVGCLVEAPFRPFLPVLAVPALALLVGAHALRWWCIRSLGVQWNTKVLVVPGAQLVERGPYRWAQPDARGWRRLLRHPNYVAVVAEGIALPLVHTAWVTALAFTLANLVLLRVRVKVEESALSARQPQADPGVRVVAG
ncbi:MAG: isoprenylcysteine carboxylmethyltransferase family protein [Kineosporiaceae bacterium]